MIATQDDGESLAACVGWTTRSVLLMCRILTVRHFADIEDLLHFFFLQVRGICAQAPSWRWARNRSLCATPQVEIAAVVGRMPFAFAVHATSPTKLLSGLPRLAMTILSGELLAVSPGWTTWGRDSCAESMTVLLLPDVMHY